MPSTGQLDVRLESSAQDGRGLQQTHTEATKPNYSEARETKPSIDHGRWENKNRNRGFYLQIISSLLKTEPKPGPTKTTKTTNFENIEKNTPEHPQPSAHPSVFHPFLPFFPLQRRLFRIRPMALSAGYTADRSKARSGVCGARAVGPESGCLTNPYQHALAPSCRDHLAGSSPQPTTI